MYDVAIIGAGVVGGMVARKLAAYRLRVCLLEKNNDVAMGATRANSAIVHAGFDAKEGSLKAKFNVQGSEMMESVARELGVKYQKNGSLVVGYHEEDVPVLEELLHRGQTNGVRDLRLIDRAELRSLEPHIKETAICALYAPTGGIVCPYELTLAAIGNAMDNGVELKRNFCVQSIERIENGFKISAGTEAIEARYIINAAGLFSDRIAAMVGDQSFNVHPRRGEYILLDKECGNLVKHTIFTTPSKMGKGILVTPTVDGNLLTGPTSVDMEDKENTATTQDGLAQVKMQAGDMVAGIPFQKQITSFCGLRAVGSTGDFIINSPVPGFINLAGIESPGLTASPAIAEYAAELLREQGLVMEEKSDFNPIRKPMHAFREATIDEKNAMIKQNRSYGKIVCRCEGVTEGEILDAIKANPRPMDLDGVKRRTRAQMGRCQGGFCGPNIVELLAQELQIPYECVTKSGGDSFVNVKRTKEAE